MALFSGALCVFSFLMLYLKTFSGLCGRARLHVYYKDSHSIFARNYAFRKFLKFSVLNSFNFSDRKWSVCELICNVSTPETIR